MRANNIHFLVVITALVFTGLLVSFILADAHIVSDLSELNDMLLILANSHHSRFMDQVMLHVGNFYFWVPFYCFLLLMALAYAKIRFMRILPFVIIYLSVQSIFLFTFNNFFKHLRPLYQQYLGLQLHISSAGKGAAYGCLPAASAAVGIALFFSLYFNQRYRLLKLILFSWAALILYSRVYNGLNYPDEIFFGALMGLTLSYMSFMAYKHYLNRYYAN